jgi:hypothetical protein
MHFCRRSLPNIISPGIILSASRSAPQRTLSPIVTVAASDCCSRCLGYHMPKPLHCTVASAVQSGPSHADLAGIHVDPSRGQRLLF